MSDIQKAIDESRLSNKFQGSDSQWMEMKPETTHVFTSSELKSLLEEVAREQLKKDIELIEDSDLVTDNLTFNEG